MRTATLNAQQALIRHKTRRTSDYVSRTQALTDLQEALGLDEAPLRIECFDISHLGGTNVVASMVVFEDGLPRKDQYRSFNIAETTDIYILTRCTRCSCAGSPTWIGLREIEPETDVLTDPLATDGEVVTTRKRPRFSTRRNCSS